MARSRAGVREALGRGQAVEPALDREQAVDTTDGFERDRRDDHRRPAPARAGDVGELEELATGMRPAEGGRHRARGALGGVESVVA